MSDAKTPLKSMTNAEIVQSVQRLNEFAAGMRFGADADPVSEPVVVEAPPVEEPVQSGPRIGQPVEDGSIYVGISPTTQRPMYLSLKDSGRISGSFNDVSEKMETLVAHGHDDWKVATSEEAQEIIKILGKGHLAKAFDLSGIGGNAHVITSTPAPVTKLVKGKKLGLDDLGREKCEPDQYVPTGEIDKDKIVIHRMNDGQRFFEDKKATRHSVFCVRS